MVQDSNPQRFLHLLISNQITSLLICLLKLKNPFQLAVWKGFLKGTICLAFRIYASLPAMAENNVITLVNM